MTNPKASCPFCGKNNFHTVHLNDTHHVECRGCNARGPMAINDDIDEGSDAAILLWDLRVNRSKHVSCAKCANDAAAYIESTPYCSSHLNEHLPRKRA